MKKIVLLLAALFTLALSTTAFAAAQDNGTVLNAEDTAATKLVETLLNNGSLSTVQDLFHPEFKKNVTEANFQALQKDISEKLGTVKDSPRLAFWERGDKSDAVFYLMSFSKENTVRCAVIFDDKNQIVNFALTPIHPEEKKDGAAK